MVHWPPTTLSNRARAGIKRSVEQFQALLEDPNRRPLRELYDEARRRTPEGFPAEELSPVREPPESASVIAGVEWQKDEALVAASASLRKSANYFCLAFSIGTEFLFLGDLEPVAIQGAVKHLADSRKVDFRRILAPHHGTVWTDELLSLRCRDLVVSVGKKLWPHVDSRLGLLARRVYTTYLQGDLRLR